jgi:hypothetical protein
VSSKHRVSSFQPRIDSRHVPATPAEQLDRRRKLTGFEYRERGKRKAAKPELQRPAIDSAGPQQQAWASSHSSLRLRNTRAWLNSSSAPVSSPHCAYFFFFFPLFIWNIASLSVFLSSTCHSSHADQSGRARRERERESPGPTRSTTTTPPCLGVPSGSESDLIGAYPPTGLCCCPSTQCHLSGHVGGNDDAYIQIKKMKTLPVSI